MLKVHMGTKPATVIPISKAELVDEFAILEIELNALKGKMKRRDDLRQMILGWHPDLPEDREALSSGSAYDVIITLPDKRRLLTLLGKKRLFKLWGVTKFLDRCAVALNQLADPKDEKGEYTVQSRTGPRHLEVQLRIREAA